MAVQRHLGSDIAMAFDECPPAGVDRAELQDAVRRTTLWAQRSRAQRAPRDSSVFGIVQGGTDLDLRARGAEEIVAPRVRRLRDRRPVGGRGARRRCWIRSRATVEMLPPTGRATSWAWATRPAWSRGSPAASTCSTACCPRGWAAPDRRSSHGGRMNLRNAAIRATDRPLVEGCTCPACAGLLARLHPPPRDPAGDQRPAPAHDPQPAPLLVPRCACPHGDLLQRALLERGLSEQRNPARIDQFVTEKRRNLLILVLVLALAAGAAAVGAPASPGPRPRAAASRSCSRRAHQHGRDHRRAARLGLERDAQADRPARHPAARDPHSAGDNTIEISIPGVKNLNSCGDLVAAGGSQASTSTSPQPDRYGSAAKFSSPTVAALRLRPADEGQSRRQGHRRKRPSAGRCSTQDAQVRTRTPSRSSTRRRCST